MTMDSPKLRQWNLTARRLAPEPLKRLLRLARLAFSPVPGVAPQLPQSTLDGCSVLASRLDMLDRLAKGGQCAELGTLKGDFAREILRRAAPDRLHLIDVDFTQLADDVRADVRVHLHQGLTVDVMRTFPDKHFDFIYIDADHSYDAVVRDIAASTAKLKPGGILAFNDFTRIVQRSLGVFGVHQAVCEFVARDKWPLVYFCLQSEAAYDVALRKPE